jgi:peptidoglycan/xylan/chitin deacetylase (PgdA/CDA1 family)
MERSLKIVMYHYVRDLPNTPFPNIKSMHIREFADQVAAFKGQYEMATLESALEFVRGTYEPSKDLCLLTFDDGLKEHYSEITPLLRDAGVQGLFFVITCCLEQRQVAPVHMNHFLMAALNFEEYRNSFLARLNEILPTSVNPADLDKALVQRTYRWDTFEVASFKYLFNFVVDRNIRDRVLKELFEETISDEESFSQSLYLNWQEAREMQSAGMVIGGHSHQHRPLAALSEDELESDLRTCQGLLLENLFPQSVWPFCYPYGKKDSFNGSTIDYLKGLGFACSFTTEIGSNPVNSDLFNLRRVDCKDT